MLIEPSATSLYQDDYHLTGGDRGSNQAGGTVRGGLQTRLYDKDACDNPFLGTSARGHWTVYRNMAAKNIQGGLAMQNRHISRTLFIVIMLVFLLNAIISTVNVIEDGALLRRVIPAVCWSIATIIWIASYLRNRQR